MLVWQYLHTEQFCNKYLCNEQPRYEQFLTIFRKLLPFFLFNMIHTTSFPVVMFSDLADYVS